MRGFDLPCGANHFPRLRRTMSPNGAHVGHHSDSQGRCPGVIEGLTSGRKEIAMWQPDGGARTRIGVLTPHADVWAEAEFGAMAPDGISVYALKPGLHAIQKIASIQALG